MLARFLVFVLALQLALFGAAGLWLCARFGWPRGWSIALAPLGVLLAETATVATSFALSRRYASDAPESARLSWGGRLRLFFGELRAYVLAFTFYQPFARRTVSGAPAAGMPVVLVPGIYCNAGLWRWFGRRLAALGVTGTWAVTLEPPWAGIDQLAERLEQEIERICARTGAARVVVVGHSMGGLIARACARDQAARAGRSDPAARARIAKIVTLGTPHHGSVLARWAHGRNGREMRPGSAWLAALNAGGAEAVPLVSVFSWHDNFVAPQDSARLPGADNAPLAGAGHLALVFSPAVARRVAREVAAAG
jgi:pimeloyl-ACP methyl ester carboxylesterase